MGTCCSKSKDKDQQESKHLEHSETNTDMHKDDHVEKSATYKTDKVQLSEKQQKNLDKKHDKALQSTYMDATRNGTKDKLKKRMEENLQKPSNTEEGDKMFGKFTDPIYENERTPYLLQKLPLGTSGTSNRLFKYILPKMPNLKSLHIIGCELAEFPSFLPENLMELKITANYLTKIGHAIKLEHLERLDLSNNKIFDDMNPEAGSETENRNFSDEIKYCKKLQYLNLSRNQIKTLPIAMFTAFPDLVEADLCANCLEELDLCLKNNSNLVNLYLTANRLTSLQYNFCSFDNHSLKKLRINQNPIDFNDQSNLGNLKALEILDIRSTKIKKIPRDIVKCENLMHIAVEDTYLTEPPQSVAERDVRAIKAYFAERSPQSKKSKMVNIMVADHKKNKVKGYESRAQIAFLPQGDDEQTEAEKLAEQDFNSKLKKCERTVQQRHKRDTKKLTQHLFNKKDHNSRNRDPVYEEQAQRQLEYSQRKFEEERLTRENQSKQKKESEQEKQRILDGIREKDDQKRAFYDSLKDLIGEVESQNDLLITLQSLISTFEEYLSNNEPLEIPTSTSYYISRIAPYHGAINILKTAGFVLQEEPFKGIYFFLKKSNKTQKTVKKIVEHLTKYADYVQKDKNRRFAISK